MWKGMVLAGWLNRVVFLIFYRKGHRERGLAHTVCVRSRMLRSPKYPAVTLWLWTVAAPSSLPAGS